MLGTVAVADFGGGDLCLAPSTGTGTLLLTSCPADGGLSYLWPADVGIRGLRTDGAPPCSSGRACDEDETAAVATGTPSAASTRPTVLPATSSLEAPRPNPFSAATEIRLALAEPSHVDLAIYDVGGRLVRQLRRDDVPAGFHGIRWDGTDSGGRPVRAGVYFVRLTTGDLHQVRKLVLVGR